MHYTLKHLKLCNDYFRIFQIFRNVLQSPINYVFKLYMEAITPYLAVQYNKITGPNVT